MTTRKMAFSLLHVDRHADLATITLNRPQQLNSFTPALVYQMRWALDDVQADPAVAGIVIAGAGKAFSMGSDIGFLLRNATAGNFDALLAIARDWHALYDAIAACDKPVVARIHGPAVGAGLELALACHGMVATSDASFQFPETGLGIFPCLGGTQRSARAIGPALAKWMIYTASSLKAADALTIGLLADLVVPDELDDCCRRYARNGFPAKSPPQLSPNFATLEAFFRRYGADELHSGRADAAGDPVLTRAMKLVSNKGPVALRFVDELIDTGWDRPLADALQMELEHVVPIYRTADALRGLEHRMQKRIGAPKFEGC